MAKTISYVYKNRNELTQFIKANELHNFSSILVQIFSGVVDDALLRDIQQWVNEVLPNSTVIGSTTAGSISAGVIAEEQVVVSFTSFEKTELKSVLFEQEEYENSFEMGKNIGSELCTSETKAVIVFPTGFDIDVDRLLEGMYIEAPHVLITGAIAGDNGRFKEGIVLANHHHTNHGVAAVALTSDTLRAQTYTNYKWQEIGKTFEITKTKGNKIYTIDNKKPIQILKHYLGIDFVNQLPLSGIEFPFILEVNGERVSIFITKVLRHGAIEVNRKVKEGDLLTLAYTDLKAMVDESLHEMKHLSYSNIETMFLYNCLGRKALAHDFNIEEMRLFHTIAPTAGFYSYGEIQHKKGEKPRLVGHSLTYLALSEQAHTGKTNALKFEYQLPKSMKTVVALTHLLEASQSDTKELNEHINVSEHYYKSLFDNNADFVYSTDLRGYFTSVNSAFEKTFGFSKTEVLGKSALNYIKEEDFARVRMHFYRALKGKEQYYNIEIPSKEGETLLFQIKNIPITVNDEPVGIYGIGRNITEQKNIEEKISQLAFYDQDTGLPNRLKFTEQLGEMVKKAKKRNKHLAVLVVDMDRFKIVNDSLGHFAGDRILKEMAERIKKVLPSGSYFGRFAGDKFTIALSKNINMDEVVKASNVILQVVSKPVFHENQEFFITASMGVSLFPSDGFDEHSLLKNADIAMNKSKYPGGNRITFFSTEMNEQALIRLELESYLRKALKKNEFHLCYQPLVDLSSGKVHGSEALIRWNHPKLGLVAPGDFIPLAEETGLIEEIGKWVLRTACIQNRKWQKMGFGDLTISVNVSAHQFQKAGFINDVKRALDESGMEPSCLTLELTESIMLRNIDYSIKVMQALQKLGVRVSIDDFGTGYSSLSYLKNLPINHLKIDRSFINNLKMDTSDIAIVKAIITMGHGLAVKVVAEGVETKEQIELLKELNCHYAQGYYIHKPLLTADFEQSLLQSINI